MKIIRYIALLTAILFLHESVCKQPVEFVIVIPSYNNAQWYKSNLDSVLCQKYDHFEVIYIDDCSCDSTGKLVDFYVRNHSLKDKVHIVHNKRRIGALGNLYKAIHTIADHKVVVTVDGDDQLAHPLVLENLAKEYAPGTIVMTYGDYVCKPVPDKSFCAPFPMHVIEHNNFRSYQWVSSHLRTFYAGLFKKIKKEDLLWKNQFYPMTWDLAMMLPMLEMASKNHFKYISEILYIYNNANPLNDHKVNKELVQRLESQIRSKPRYEPLDRFDFLEVPE